MDHEVTDVTASEEQKLSKGVAIVATIAAAVCAAAMVLAVFSWLGWVPHPWLGWLVAKGAWKLAVIGSVGFVGLPALLRQGRTKKKGDAGSGR
ncbi:hypothetical protein [Streptomyces sp. PSKA30]|uniref:hypothetical protein n=1 Tax=Streptomyces sp. PSKA30 TaxID=2874597 RepID=UPI001CD081CE|nr:hypothetical protein [Streptomyces sp. PSKA30]MBZ9642696.1 hypothetical protein [Streptomyces sp. PSKA30]